MSAMYGCWLELESNQHSFLRRHFTYSEGTELLNSPYKVDLAMIDLNETLVGYIYYIHDIYMYIYIYIYNIYTYITYVYIYTYMSFLFILLLWLSNEILWSINKLKQRLWCTIWPSYIICMYIYYIYIFYNILYYRYIYICIINAYYSCILYINWFYRYHLKHFWKFFSVKCLINIKHWSYEQHFIGSIFE